MSTYLGTTLLAGSNTETKLNAHSLFDFKFTDHKLNEMSWLRADTFSWQNGDVYSDAYNHLSTELLTATSSTETIGSYTITVYTATDGHKLVLSDMETTVDNIFNETGVAWYYIVDTTNTRFKLPRTKYGFSGLRDTVGKYIPESLPNISGNTGMNYGGDWSPSGAFYTNGTDGKYGGTSGTTSRVLFNASRSSSTYQDGASVQEKSTQMYLYFYVGEFSQTAIEQTAGGVQEMVESKADLDLANTGRITNCITYIPQDIKLELSNGTLTLKSGSKLYIPNGTSTFDTLTTTADISMKLGSVETRMAVLSENGTAFTSTTLDKCISGSSAPSGTGRYIWYDTTNNLVKVSEDGGSTWVSARYTLPYCIYSATTVSSTTQITSIDQVFNGIGYIGGIVFTLPGVKGLIPSGRNSDGSLNSIEYTVPSVIKSTLSFNIDQASYITLDTENNAIGRHMMTATYYDESTNYLIKTDGTDLSKHIVIGTVVGNGTTVTSFTPKTCFHALDYNDKGIIAGWGMPSSTYTNLTLGASGSTYTAPANGWVQFYMSQPSTHDLQVYLSNETKLLRVRTYQSTNDIACYIPVASGDIFKLEYTYNSGSYQFRFIYAKGEI